MKDSEIGIGPTNVLSLRVSAAVLCRVMFPNPGDETPMLALEHKAFLDYYGDGSQVIVKAQPFGGGAQILDQKNMLKITGGFNYDSKRSRAERDLRIFIRPARWEEVRDFCIQRMNHGAPGAVESDPTRELAEEFHDALGIQIKPHQYSVKPVGTVVENEPVPTSSLRSAGSPTARIYYVYQAQILDPGLIRMMAADSEANTAAILRARALEDAEKGGKGRANAVLAVTVEKIRRTYLALPAESRAEMLEHEGTLLDGNVAAVLEGVPVPKFQRGG